MTCGQAKAIETTPGAAVDYEHVAERLKDVFDDYHVTKVAFDAWNFVHLKPWLRKAGFSEQLLERTFVEFGQGYKSMSPALRDLEPQRLTAARVTSALIAASSRTRPSGSVADTNPSRCCRVAPQQRL